MIGSASPDVSLRFVTTTSGQVKYAGVYTDNPTGQPLYYSDFYGSVSSATTTTLFSGSGQTSPATFRALSRATFAAVAAWTIEGATTLAPWAALIV